MKSVSIWVVTSCYWLIYQEVFDYLSGTKSRIISGITRFLHLIRHINGIPCPKGCCPYLGIARLFQSSFVIILILHGILILIALTPIGEGIMRLLNHTKKIKTREYQDYLYPLFEEVYEQAKKQNPHLSQNITLFMNNDTSPNAFACASNTVCVTKGAIDFFTREELQGVLAHEFGHLSNNDTKVCMVFVIGNLLVIVFMTLFNALFWVADTIVSMIRIITKLLWNRKYKNIR